MKKVTPTEPNKLLDTAVDMVKVIVVETEALRLRVSVGSEGGKKVEDRVAQQAGRMRDGESELRTAPESSDVAAEPPFLVAGPALPLDPFRTTYRRPTRASNKNSPST